MQMPNPKIRSIYCRSTPTYPAPLYASLEATICCKLSCVGAIPHRTKPNSNCNPYPNPTQSNPIRVPLRLRRRRRRLSPPRYAPLCLLTMRGKLIFQLPAPHSCRLPVPAPSRSSPLPTPYCTSSCVVYLAYILIFIICGVCSLAYPLCHVPKSHHVFLIMTT